MTRRGWSVGVGERSRARYVGIDLAWGERARTGVAVSDGAGALVESTTVRTDDEIAAVLEPHRDHIVAVAVDAPLIVLNPTGRRPCEAQIGQAFGRYRAGAYPANTGNRHFRPPRAAMVGLFGLDGTIPYKVRQGRNLASLKAAYERLLDHMEADLPELRLREHYRWQTVRASVRASERKAVLRRFEDEIDAIVCAHLAWLWTTRRDALRVYGDVETGYIVAPPPPSSSAATTSASN